MPPSPPSLGAPAPLGQGTGVTAEAQRLEALLAAWDGPALIRLQDVLVAARFGSDASHAATDHASTAAGGGHLPPLVVRLLLAPWDGSGDAALASGGGDGSTARLPDDPGPSTDSPRAVGAGGVPSSAATPQDTVAGDPRPSPDPTRAGEAQIRNAGPEREARPVQPAAPLDRDQVRRLALRLADATPFAALGLQEAVALLWAALPQALSDTARARGVFLRAAARIAAADPRAVGLEVLIAAAHDMLAVAGSEAASRLAARTALARMRYEAVGTPRARSLARAALGAVVPGLEPTGSETFAGLVTRMAGLVLFAPHLKRLFERGGVLAADGALRPDRLAQAKTLLQALGGGAAALNDPLENLLLGLAPGQPLPAEPPDPELEALTDGLVRAVIAQWGALGRTSPEGLREAFVRREGELAIDPDGAARLRVLPGPFDMLLDRLPWSIALVRLPWMGAPLHVRWREP
ncbi:MAG: contractile injection system tape measure protein [Alkalilacustris sp.]